jgi:hypothetical protein
VNAKAGAVVSHRAISTKKERQSGLLDCEVGKELAIVLSAIEDRLTVIAAGNHVIETTWDFNSGVPGHGSETYFSFSAFALLKQESKNRKPDPFLALPQQKNSWLARSW